MIKWVKNHWHDPVWSNVIAASLFALLAAGFTYFLDWWPLFSRAILVVWEFVFSSSSVPNWLLGILIFLSLLLILIITIRYVVWKKDIQYLKNNSQPSWGNYTTDNFFNIRWRWRYDEGHNIVDLNSFCSSCDFQIYPKLKYDIMRQPVGMTFRCEGCGKDFGEHQTDIAQFENLIIRHIQQKIRNDSWKAVQISSNSTVQA